MELPQLRSARLRRLMTQAELANRARMTQASISHLETGATRARISTVRKLAAALGVSAADLTSHTTYDAPEKEESS